MQRSGRRCHPCILVGGVTQQPLQAAEVRCAREAVQPWWVGSTAWCAVGSLHGGAHVGRPDLAALLAARGHAA